MRSNEELLTIPPGSHPFPAIAQINNQLSPQDTFCDSEPRRKGLGSFGSFSVTNLFHGTSHMGSSNMSQSTIDFGSHANDSTPQPSRLSDRHRQGVHVAKKLRDQRKDGANQRRSWDNQKRISEKVAFSKSPSDVEQDIPGLKTLTI